MNQYWLNEKPLTAKTSKNVISLYEVSNKLTIALPPWTDAQGVQRPGKTLGLDLTALREAPPEELDKAKMIFDYVLEQIAEKMPLIDI